MPYTCDCRQKLDLSAALDALPTDHMGSSGMFSPVCSGCGRSIEVRLKNGGFEVGFSYFGGSMHFEPMQRVKVKGLIIAASDPDDLTVSIGSRQWHFGIRRISNSRFCVFAQAFATGKRVDELNFTQWGVSLTGMERGHIPLEYSDATVIEPNDFLWLSGPSPYLTRAWHYMHDGYSSKTS